MVLFWWDVRQFGLGENVKDEPKGLSAGDAILYSVIAAVLSFFFFAPISSFVTEAVRPSIERALGERE